MGRTKNVIHFAQALIIFIAWAMTIAIWTKGGSGIDGRTAWYWALVSFTCPFSPCRPRLEREEERRF
jgi:hypothetical protein